MKKIFKIIMVCILSFMIPIVTHAGGKELVIDFSKTYEDLSNFTEIQETAWTYLVNNGDIKLVSGDYIINHFASNDIYFGPYENDNGFNLTSLLGYTNSNDKLLLTFDYLNNYMAVMHDVTSNDNIRVTIDENKLEEAGLYELYDYESIYVKFGPMLQKEEAEELMIDFILNKKIDDFSEIQNRAMVILLKNGLIKEKPGSLDNEYLYYNQDGKYLFEINYKGEIILANNLTVEDNIEYTLTDEEIAMLREMMPFPYKKIKVNFSQAKEKSDQIIPEKITNPLTGNKLLITISLISIILIIGTILIKRTRQN